jgi:manganese oxidase
VGVLAVGVGLAGSLPTTARLQAPGPGEQACTTPTRSRTLYAEERRNGRVAYGRTPERATIPGPTIQMTEGDCLEITLVNHTDRVVSLHPHGVDYTVASDGSPHTDSCVRPGRSRTYVWSTHSPQVRADGTVRPGSAGYWHYHDHCMGSEHGTEGIRRGLFGALIVRRAGDRRPDRRPIVLVMSGTQFNLRSAPHTPRPKANMGQRVEFVIIGHGELLHTFHLHGHRWADTRTGMTEPPVDPSEDEVAVIDNKTLGPGDSFGFQIVAGEGVGPGAWMYHCHVQGHADAGMSGIFVVREPGGGLAPGTRAAIRAWEAHTAHLSH